MNSNTVPIGPGESRLGSKGCATESEYSLESLFSRMGQADGTRVAHPGQPLHLNKPREQGRAHGTSDVVVAFRPIEALVGEGAPQRLQRIRIDVESAQEFLAGGRHREAVFLMPERASSLVIRFAYQSRAHPRGGHSRCGQNVSRARRSAESLASAPSASIAAATSAFLSRKAAADHCVRKPSGRRQEVLTGANSRLAERLWRPWRVPTPSDHRRPAAPPASGCVRLRRSVRQYARSM